VPFVDAHCRIIMAMTVGAACQAVKEDLMPTQELAILRARVAELELEQAALKTRVKDLADLVDRLLVLINQEHSTHSPAFQEVERVAEKALRPL
jgi:hypothetical protein